MARSVRASDFRGQHSRQNFLAILGKAAVVVGATVSGLTAGLSSTGESALAASCCNRAVGCANGSYGCPGTTSSTHYCCFSPDGKIYQCYECYTQTNHCFVCTRETVGGPC